MYTNAKKLYLILLSIYYNDYNDTTEKEKERMDKKYDPKNLLINGERFIESKREDEEKSKSQPEETIAERAKFRREKADDKELLDTSSPSTDDDCDEFIDIPDMPPLEGNERVKEGKGLKILAPNKFLTRFPMLLAQIKTGYNSYKLKKEIRQVLYLFYQHNEITKKVYSKLMKSFSYRKKYNNGRKYDSDKRSKNVLFFILI